MADEVAVGGGGLGEVNGGDPSPVQVGRCALCKQEMIADDSDCWHPYTVPIACPPEPPDARMRTKEAYEAWQAFYASGLRPGRPGRQHFEPMPDDAWVVTGTSESMREPYWLGYIFTLDEARADGRDPRVSEDGIHCNGRRFSAHRLTVFSPTNPAPTAANPSKEPTHE